MTISGLKKDLRNVNKWFGTLPHTHKIVISGNMDGLTLATKYSDQSNEIFNNAIYLKDQQIELCGLKIYGTPWTPKFCGGFQYATDEQAQKIFDKIPDDTDILICHGPPFGILDKTSRG